MPNLLPHFILDGRAAKGAGNSIQQTKMKTEQRLSILSALPGSVRRRRSAHDIALQNIGVAIVKGDYPTGSLLPSKEELMGWLDVSKTTLREALQTLAAKGMVAARAKVGTRVLSESHWNMFDGDILAWRLEIGMPTSFLAMLFEIRQSLEPVAAALAAVRRNDEDVARLRELAGALNVASDNRSAFVETDVKFHQYILETAANPFLQSLGALISTALTASFTLSAPTEYPQLSSLVQQQHINIVDAIEARDPQGASDAMVTVIQQGWTNYSGSGSIDLAQLKIRSFHQTLGISGRSEDDDCG